MEFPPISFKGDKTAYITPSWNQLAELTFTLAKKIIEDRRQYDRVVTIAKGGWPVSSLLVDLLGIDYVASLGVRFYEGINKPRKTPQLYQDLPFGVKGERVLLFDDVADTGRSFLYACEHLRALNIRSITIASLFYKPHSEVTPDYWVSETTAWIVFPYDVRESVRLLRERWGKMGVATSEMKRRFDALGFNRKWVDYLIKELG